MCGVDNLRVSVIEVVEQCFLNMGLHVNSQDELAIPLFEETLKNMIIRQDGPNAIHAVRFMLSSALFHAGKLKEAADLLTEMYRRNELKEPAEMAHFVTVLGFAERFSEANAIADKIFALATTLPSDEASDLDNIRLLALLHQPRPGVHVQFEEYPG